MFFFVSGIIILLIALGIIIASRKNPDILSGGGLAGGAGVVLALLMIGFSCITMVPTKNVGVAIAFGQPIGSYKHGLHLKAPWVNVEDMDATIQNSVYNGDNRIPVRLGSTASAHLDVSIQWQLKEEGAVSAYTNYRPKDNQSSLDVIQSNVIDRNLRSAINTSFGAYDPLSNESMNDGKGIGVELRSFEQQVLEDMRKAVDGQVEIISVTITNIDFDSDTDKRISDYQAEIAKTRNAEQAKKTAEQEAEANRILTESLSDQVNTANCLAIVEKNNQSPLGCFPNTGVSPVTSVDK